MIRLLAIALVLAATPALGQQYTAKQRKDHLEHMAVMAGACHGLAQAAQRCVAGLAIAGAQAEAEAFRQLAHHYGQMAGLTPAQVDGELVTGDAMLARVNRSCIRLETEIFAKMVTGCEELRAAPDKFVERTFGRPRQ